MISLRIKAETPSAVDPFVVRLRSCRAQAADCADDAYLLGANGNVLEYKTNFGLLRLKDVRVDEVEEDVLLIVPARGTAHRLIRAQSHHNSFLVTERCDQLCVMCSQPPKRHHIDLFPLFERAARLAPKNATIGITGGEPTLFKHDLFHFLVSMSESRPDLRFHVLTNAQHFIDEDIDPLRRLAEVTLWGIPLYAATDTTHDEIVGKDGAFTRLGHSLSILARAGSAIELRTVVLSKNVHELPRLALFLARQVPFIALWAIMQLENIGYGRKNWKALFFDSSRDFAPIGVALDIARASGIDMSLYNFPLCTIPEGYRSFGAPSIADWKRRYLPICEACELREACGGFFEWYPEASGFAAIGPPS